VAQMLPRQLHWFFKRFAANGYALEVKNASAELDRAVSEKNNRAIVLALHFGFSLAGGLYSIHISLQHENMLLKILGIALLVRSAWIAFRQLS
jgi:hypothetical protein